MNIQPEWLARGLILFALSALVGCSSSSSPPAAQPPPPDSTAPTVSVVQAPLGTVNRIVALSATANDNVGVNEVRFFVDGQMVGTDSTSPYTFDWDTSAVSDGEHVLRAEAVDAEGNVGQSVEVTVTVQNTVQFDVTLSGEQEVPPRDTVASAQADLTVNLASGEVQGELTAVGLVPTAAHIHDAFAGSNGGVVIGLDQDSADALHFTVPAGAMLDAAAVDRLLAGGLYLNVHTAAAPAGAVRGQILPDGFVLRFTDLSGDEQVPQVDTFGRGRAAATLDPLTGAFVLHAQIEELDASQAHVHEGYAGANGPVLVALAQDQANANHWFAEGETLNAAALDAFAAGRFYVNFHSQANPGGEIRGQIVPEGIAVIFAELSGEQRIPAVTTLADGLGALTLDEAGALLTIHVNTRGIDDASAAHLHGAFGGTNGGVEVGLTQDGSNPAHWFVEAQTLTSDQLDALLDGATYLNVHSPSNPGGEIRGQVIPAGILFATGILEGGQAVPPVASAGGGSFAVTVDTTASTLVAHVNTSGLDDATAAHLHDAYAGTSGGVAVGLTQDGGDVAHWSAIDAPLDAAALAAFSGGRYYVNVHTPANPGGEVRGQVAPPPVEVLFTALSGDQEVPAIASAAGGIAASTVNRETGVLTLHVNTTDADDASAAHIHTGYAGQGGPVLVGLTQDAGNVARWSLVEEQLDGLGLADYLAGRLYVNVHTPANPAGEVRGQIAPEDIRVLFSAMDGDQVEPAVVTTASGVVATTVDLTSRAFVAFVNGIDVDDASSAGIHLGDVGENGAEVLALEQTLTLPSQWSGESAPLDMDTFLSYRAGLLYAQVATPAQPDGEIRGQIVPPDAAEHALPVTLTQLQSEIFTPICSGCHSGPTGNMLPSGMNLSSAADSFAALVGVPSLQVDSLNRVTAGDPDNSYLVQKLEGTAAVGGRMPLGGALDQAMIDMVRQWIIDDALNN